MKIIYQFMKFDGLSFGKEVREVVRMIPRGMVLTYGDVSLLAGFPGHARMVGRVLGMIGETSDVPCHRVVNSQGRIAPHWPNQAALLRGEGVIFTRPGYVDMEQCHWKFEKYLT